MIMIVLTSNKAGRVVLAASKMWNWSSSPKENPYLAYGWYVLHEAKIAELWLLWSSEAFAKEYTSRGWSLDIGIYQ